MFNEIKLDSTSTHTKKKQALGTCVLDFAQFDNSAQFEVQLVLNKSFEYACSTNIDKNIFIF